MRVNPDEIQVGMILNGHVEGDVQDEEILVTWKERPETDDARIGAMYCFKNCDKNKN